MIPHPPSSDSPNAATALVPLIDGFEETEAVATIDILRRAGVSVLTAGIGKGFATGSHQIIVETDALLDDVLEEDYEAIVLPGGPGTPKLNEIPALHSRLRRQAESGMLVAAICAAPSVLAAAGLLEGKRATCFPSVEGKMAGAVIVREPVVVTGNIVTSRGVGTAIPFALEVAARLVGRERAAEVARAIVYDGFAG